MTSPKIFQKGKKGKNQSLKQQEREQILKLLSCPEFFPPVEQEYYFSSVWPPMIFQNGKENENQSVRQLEREQILNLLSCPECFPPVEQEYYFSSVWLTYDLSKWQKGWISISKATGKGANPEAFILPRMFSTWLVMIDNSSQTCQNISSSKQRETPLDVLASLTTVVLKTVHL